MKCPHCSAPIESDAQFCGACGGKVGQSVGAAELLITVGRKSDNKITLSASTVSSHHAQFRVTGNTVMLEDLDSANGTFVNGARVTLSCVTEKDEIRFGHEVIFPWTKLKNAIAEHGMPAGQETKKDLPVNVPKSLSAKPVISIGRTDENDIPIRSVRVSRHHARLTREGSQWSIEDLGSTNGTFVNGKKIKIADIDLSDTILIGGLPLRLQNLFSAGKTEDVLGDISLSADHLTFSVGSKTIVDDVSVTMRPGEFVGLIGPSGAGKTSLMLMLNGVAKPTQGTVFINGASLYQNLDSFKGLIGYVPQDDIIHRELTVEESLQFTARLRFEGTMGGDEIRNQVDQIIQTLELEETRKTLIGTAEKKGISGGQRKRVNLGQELMTEPSLLFLDEPTSGLDPKTDMEVMELLRTIAKKGKIVLLTTHNITVENFEILTHVVVLARGGKLVYFGPAAEAVAYFGVKKPFEIFDVLKQKDPDHWQNAYKASSYYNEYIRGRMEGKKDQKYSTGTSNSQTRKTGLGQFFTLAGRYMLIKLRDKISTAILLLQAPIIAVLIALVFSKPEESVAALFVLAIAAIWLGCSNAAREIVAERSIFKRERMDNLKIPSYVFSKLVVLTLLCVVQCLILAGIVVPSLGLHISTIKLTGLLLVTSVAAMSIGLFLSSLVKTNDAAMALTPIVLIPQVILGGLVSKFIDMSPGIKVLAGLMMSRWSFEAVMIGEFKDNQAMNISGIGFDPDNMVIDICVLLLCSVIFLALAAHRLRRENTA